jgi:biopolymer transport protein ExbD
MTIQFGCPHCSKKLKASDEHRGAKVRCSGCGQIVVVPQALPVERPQAPAVIEEDFEPQSFKKRPPTDDELDMTPMIDMTFLLLIFFMVTAAFSLQKSIQMPAPDAENAAQQSRTLEDIEEDDDFIIVRIDSDNTIWVNDSIAPSRHEVLAKLRDLREAGDEGPGSLLVMASPDCLHENVVMVLDAGTAVGMESVRLANLDADDL